MVFRRFATKLSSVLLHPQATVSRSVMSLRISGTSGYLSRSGWLRSATAKMAVDAEGAPLPWYTYAAIAFLAPRLRSDMHVFEYGTGNSSLWYAGRVGSLSGCEHDPEWLRMVASRLPTNANVVHRPASSPAAYVNALSATGRRFEIVVVDGLHRNECLDAVDANLAEHGVVVLDNADVADFRPGISRMHERGYRWLEFSGLGPINVYGWTTAVFYRSGNCLGI
jgi:hypothetical protein